MKIVLVNSYKEEGTSTAKKLKWSQPMETKFVNPVKKGDINLDCDSCTTTYD